MDAPTTDVSKTKLTMKEQVTPHKVVMLLLMHEYCTKVLESQTATLCDERDRYSEKEERNLIFTMLKLLQGADFELVNLMEVLRDVCKPQIMDSLSARLCVILDKGVEGIMEVFKDVPEALMVDHDDQPALVQRTSVMGLFVRRMVLAFEKLSFSNVTRLYTKYRLYCRAWHKDQGEGPDASMTDMSMSIVEIMGNPDEKTADFDKSVLGTDSGKYSQKQAELFIAQQAFLLQHDELEALPPRKLQDKITELLQTNPELAEAYYLSYLNQMRFSEYCGAIESLYHYFDSHMIQGSAQNQAANKNKAEDDVIGRGFRYASLSMAALQFRFGHRAEALAAVQEAIRMSQEANDNTCLQHALGWLQRLGVQGTGSAAYLLDRLVTKSGELNMPYLTSLGVQAFAQHNALATAEPSSVFEFLMKSDIINCQHSLSDLMCVSYAQKAALWNTYGFREMCSLSCQLLLHLYTEEMGVSHSGEAECLALCHLTKINIQMTNYRAAQEILAEMKRRCPQHNQYAHIWMLCEQQMAFDKAVHHGKWDSAQDAILNIAALNKMEAKYCRAVLLKEKGDASPAMELVQSLITEIQNDTSQPQHTPELGARLLLLKGEILCRTGYPSTAGQPLLSCLTLCREHRFTYLAAITTLHVAYVQFVLGMPRQALKLLEECLLTILCQGIVYDQARAKLLWAKCKVAASNNDNMAPKKTVLLEAVQLVGNAIDKFHKVEARHRAKEALYYQARLYHELGYTSERNKCALEYKQLDTQYPTWSKTVIATF